MILNGILNEIPSMAKVKIREVSLCRTQATQHMLIIKDPLQGKIFHYDNVGSILNVFIGAHRRWPPNEILAK